MRPPPDGQTLGFALDAQVHSVRATAPFGSEVPRPLLGHTTGGFCEDDELRPVYVDQFVAWSTDGSRIAVFNHADCQLDNRLDWYFPATGERRMYSASGADCCGYTEWSELFWGPGSESGNTERDLGPYGQNVDAPSRIVYPGFRSRRRHRWCTVSVRQVHGADQCIVREAADHPRERGRNPQEGAGWPGINPAGRPSPDPVLTRPDAS